MYVQNHYIGFGVVGLGNGLQEARSFLDDLNSVIMGKDPPNTIASDGVVVGKQDPQHEDYLSNAVEGTRTLSHHGVREDIGKV
ncbi:MAG TPA: hypothetical protein VJP02_21110 [Candidatus Sulfotelmatobacter sp.]|nr:hypothetical protein [Candidatus Sulfotelmatobacter sp.]